MAGGQSDEILSDAQWEKVRQVVHDEALRARVAASFLPLYGPLAADTEAVPKNRLELDSTVGLGESHQPSERMAVVDYETIRLSTIALNVHLKSQQVSDPELSSALIMFRRAADIIARVEDAIIFNGQRDVAEGPVAGADNVPNVYSVSGGGRYNGLLDINADQKVIVEKSKGSGMGEAVFSAVVKAILRLESTGHLGPFACVLGDDLFLEANKPIPNSMVLPRDSILPFLDGPLLRSSALPANRGVVVSLQGNPVEIVVPSDIAVRYLQTTLEARHVFRISQRFVLRVKEPAGVVSIES